MGLRLDLDTGRVEPWDERPCDCALCARRRAWIATVIRDDRLRLERLAGVADGDG